METIKQKLSDFKVIYNKQQKKCFVFNEEIIVSAAGVMLKNDTKFLLQKYTDEEYIKNHGCYVYADFGGKTDNCDNDVYETVIREASEESNGKLKISKQMLQIAEKYYFKNSKYLLFVVNTKCTYKKVIYKMGNSENHDKIPRVVGWYSTNTLQEYHPRLREYFKVYSMQSISSPIANIS